ncbi:MAG: autotransporter domain-containing protein [Emcibacteraceae bacterium]|nr:autotransporter domain-containing protein [Emcibacteraceae bacterium]
MGGVIESTSLGAAIVSQSDTSVSNAGSIIGDVTLSAAADDFTLLSTGAYNGSIDGGDGVDDFFVQGNHTISNVTNFENTSFTDGLSTWDDNTASVNNLTLNNASLNYSGFAQVANIMNGSRLFGNASFQNLTVSGVLAPGNSAGTTTVIGNYAQLSTATYEAEVFADGTHDLIDVSGTATLDGTLLVQFVDDSADYAGNEQYTVLTADGGIVGDFETSLASGLTGDLFMVYNIIGNDVVVNLFFGPRYFDEEANTPNNLQASAVGSAIATNVDGATALFGASLEEINTVLEQVSGATHATMASFIGMDDNEYLNAVVSEDRSIGKGNVTNWVKTYGLAGKASGSSNNRGFDYDTLSVATGFGFGLSDAWTVGLHGGYITSNVTLGIDAAKVRSAKVGAYTAINSGQFKLTGAYSRGWHDVEMTRAINFAGVANNNSDNKSDSFYAEASYLINIGQLGFEPTAGYNYTTVSALELNETCASVANLNGATNKFKSSQVRGGVKFNFNTNLGGKGNLTPKVKVMYVRELGDLNGGLVTGYEGGDEIFSASGLIFDKNRVEVDAGIHYQINNVSLNIGYRGSYASRIKSHGGRAGVTLVW